MKRITCTIMSTLLLFAVYVLPARAADIDFESRSTAIVEIYASLIEKVSKQIQQHNGNQLSSGKDTVAPDGATILASAPPVTYLEFTGVLSENWSSWEDIAPNQLSTVYDHGGAWMYLEVLELGYGYDYAWMNGVLLNEVYTYYVTDSSGTVIGFIHYYDASGFQGGYATTEARSINYPFNLMSDALNVR